MDDLKKLIEALNAAIDLGQKTAAIAPSGIGKIIAVRDGAVRKLANFDKLQSKTPVLDSLREKAGVQQ